MCAGKASLSSNLASIISCPLLMALRFISDLDDVKRKVCLTSEYCLTRYDLRISYLLYLSSFVCCYPILADNILIMAHPVSYHLAMVNSNIMKGFDQFRNLDAILSQIISYLDQNKSWSNSIILGNIYSIILGNIYSIILGNIAKLNTSETQAKVIYIHTKYGWHKRVKV